jgi:hypothetical protein|tara:strand:+ start:829 stop:1014 length:186 start_codon:yes stop_codon:yes gene_type:complete
MILRAVSYNVVAYPDFSCLVQCEDPTLSRYLNAENLEWIVPVVVRMKFVAATIVLLSGMLT